MQDLEDKLVGFNQQPGAVVSPPVGTVVFNPSGTFGTDRIAAWDGTTWRLNLNHVGTWSAWQNLDLRSPVVARSGFSPRVRVNAYQRRIVIYGGVVASAALGAWPATALEITTDTAIGPEFAPVPGGLSYYQGVGAGVTGANQVATANIKIEHITVGTPRVAISVLFQGDAGGGNFVMLDGLEWWY